MSLQRPILLAVGRSELSGWLQSLIDGCDGYVYHADETLKALSLYALYFPDVVIVDARPDQALAESIVSQLDAVTDMAANEPIIIINDGARRWSLPSTRTVHSVSDEAALCELLAALLELAPAQPF